MIATLTGAGRRMRYGAASGFDEGSARSAGSSLKPVANKRSALASKVAY